jgi:hypothetical protein
MNPEKWRRFRWSMSTGLVLMTWFLFRKDVFDDRSFVTLSIVFLSYLGIGAATYVFWKRLPGDSRWMQ